MKKQKIESDQVFIKYKETYLFQHKGVKIWVKIDYINNKISLVEPFGSSTEKFQQKKWLFHERGIEYMFGWIDILEAMQEAIKHAKYRYEMQEALRSEKAEAILVNGMLELDKAKKAH